MPPVPEMPVAARRPSRSAVRAGILLAVGALWLAEALPAAAGALTIATFNAEFLTRPKVHVKFGHPFDLRGQDRKTWETPGYRDAKFAEATRRVARYIAEHAPADVLALTEVGDRRDVAELRDRLAEQGLDLPHVEVCDCTARRTAQHVALLSRFPLTDAVRRLPGREGYFEELDDAESEADTGISKGLAARFEAAGRTFRLYAVHFASERGGHWQDAQRIAQASILRRLTLAAINAGEHVIVAGDLNDRRGDPALRRVRGLDDIWPDLTQTGHHRYFRDDGERWTIEFRGQREQLDHILLSRSILAAAKRGGIRASTGPTPGKGVSDHRPLIVTLTFR